MEKIANKVVASITTVLIGKEQPVKLALACLFARGHLLIEDLPGMGKTTLAQGVATTLGLSYSRVQFTSDLLPADIVGISIFEKTKGQFTFHPGPVFNQLLLADEINRASPKTQSALLEAMAEKQVTVDGETRPLPSPFFVIATQNPQTQSGTFPLPESQLDRFLMKLSIGYPDSASERKMLTNTAPSNVKQQLKTLLKPAQLLEIQQLVDKVTVSDSLVDYLQRLIQFTRDDSAFFTGLSPRGGLAVLQGSKAWALIHGRKHVVPEDVQAVFPHIAGHRVMGAGEFAGQPKHKLTDRVLSSVDVLA